MTKKRELPKVALFQDNCYASLLAQGFDSLAEVFNLRLPEASENRLIALKAECMECHGSAKEPKMEIDFGGEVLQLWGTSAGRASYCLQGRDFRILIRSSKTAWPVTVEYTSEGLWHIGYYELHRQAVSILMREMRIDGEGIDISEKNTWCRLSRLDYAFDFYSSKFMQEMKPEIYDRFILPKGTKKRLEGAGDWIETVTLGKKGTLQVQIYDKGREITEISGKEWMFRIWEREGYYPPEDFKAKDVWRLELRFFSEYLRNRAILTMDDFFSKMNVLLAEVLFTRRLTVRSHTDENRWRWPMHPIWVMAYEAAGAAREFASLERRMTMRGSALYSMLCKQVAGLVRSLTELKVGDYDPDDARKIVEAALTMGEEDPDHEMKCRRAYERYRWVDVRREDAA